MKKKKNYVKNKKEDKEMYKEISFDVEKSLEARLRLKSLKRPTSVALEPETIEQLKTIAAEKGIPYQVLMRSYILRGLKEDQAS